MKRTAAVIVLVLALAGLSRAEAQIAPRPPTAPNPAPKPVQTAVQETYCITAPPAQVTRLDDAIARSNALTCSRLGLPTTCTQAQACAANTQCVGGSACTPAQARTCNTQIWDNTSQPGRQEFVNEMTRIGFLNMEQSIKAFDNTAYCEKFKVSTRAKKDESCIAVGFVAGCEVCQ